MNGSQIYVKNKRINSISYTDEGYANSLWRFISSPREFYRNHSDEWHIQKPLIFLLAVSSLYSFFEAILHQGKWEWNFTMYFINSFLGTILFALLLYLVASIVCNKKYSMISVLNISVYANITLLLAWIPGMSWIMGIWRFYMIGIGLYRIAHVSKVKVFMILFLTGTSIICIYNLGRYLLCQ